MNFPVVTRMMRETWLIQWRKIFSNYWLDSNWMSSMKAWAKVSKDKEKEFGSIRFPCQERCRKLELQRKKLEDKMKESNCKRSSWANLISQIVQPRPCNVNGSFADIRSSITLGKEFVQKNELRRRLTVWNAGNIKLKHRIHFLHFML